MAHATVTSGCSCIEECGATARDTLSASCAGTNFQKEVKRATKSIHRYRGSEESPVIGVASSK